MKKILIPIALITVVAIIFAIYSAFQSPVNIPQMMDEVSNAKPETTEENTTNTTTTEATSVYKPYTPQVLNESSNTRRILFFYANWCPTCRPVDQSLSQNPNTLPPNTTVIRVNYNDTETDNEERELARKYGVTYQHTFVQIDSNGNEIAKWNGGGIDQINANIQ